MWKKLTTILSLLTLAVLLALPLAAKPPAGKGGGGEPPPEPPADPAIAYSTGPLKVMNADATNQTVIWDGNGRANDSSWSPDLDGDPTNGYQGSLVFERQFVQDYATKFDVWVIDVIVTQSGAVVGDNLRNLSAADSANPAWSPRGDLIAFDDLGGPIGGPPGGIFVVPPTGGPPTQVVQGPTDGWVDSATWSPDGTHIAYRKTTSGGDSLMLKQVVDPATGDLIDGPETVVIPEQAGFDFIFELDWSRLGEEIAFRGEGPMLNTAIYLAVVEPGQFFGTFSEVPSTSGAGSPTWSSDDPLTPIDETDMFLVYSESPNKGPARTLLVRQDLATENEAVLIDKKHEHPRLANWRRFPSVFLEP